MSIAPSIPEGMLPQVSQADGAVWIRSPWCFSGFIMEMPTSVLGYEANSGVRASFRKRIPGRVDLGGCPPKSPTDPGLHITRTRFLIS